MKNILICIFIVACSGCSVTGPYTGTKYEIGYNNNDGVFIKAKPLVFDKITGLLD